MEITGVHNPLIKAAAELKQKKYRQQRKEFLAEGLRTAEEAVRYGKVKTLFYTDAENARMRQLLERAAAKNIELVRTGEAALQKIADTETPQGVIALCCMPDYALEEAAAQGKMLLVLDRVSDPGNIGAMLRTADAAGIGGIVLLKGCADLYAPKTVRASMGSLFHMSAVCNISEEDFIAECRALGYELLVTSLDGADNLYKADLSGRLAFVMGNEAQGVSDTLLERADKRVFIPMEGRAESLNVAMAAGVVMFEALRRRLKI